VLLEVHALTVYPYNPVNIVALPELLELIVPFISENDTDDNAETTIAVIIIMQIFDALAII
jgi:hypothetical protein